MTTNNITPNFDEQSIDDYAEEEQEQSQEEKICAGTLLLVILQNFLDEELFNKVKERYLEYIGEPEAQEDENLLQDVSKDEWWMDENIKAVTKPFIPLYGTEYEHRSYLDNFDEEQEKTQEKRGREIGKYADVITPQQTEFKENPDDEVLYD